MKEERPLGNLAGRGFVLVVDDQPLNRVFVELMLKPLGFELSFAENGQQGAAACARDDFDLVLMDIQMPVMDGHSSVRAIRAQEASTGRRRTPIAMFSSNSSPELEAEAVRNGADSFIQKPTCIEMLLAGMSSAVERSRIKSKAAGHFSEPCLSGPSDQHHSNEIR